MSAPKGASLFCAFARAGVHCDKGYARRVEIMPGMVTTLCVCDFHFEKLENRAAELRQLCERAA